MKINCAVIALIICSAGTYAAAAPPLPSVMVRLALSGTQVDSTFVAGGALSVSVGAASTHLDGAIIGRPALGIATAVGVGGAIIAIDGTEAPHGNPYETQVICVLDPCYP